MSTVEHNLFCVKCQYNLRTLPTNGVCPECGEKIEKTIAENATKPQWIALINESVQRSAVFIPLSLQFPLMFGAGINWAWGSVCFVYVVQFLVEQFRFGDRQQLLEAAGIPLIGELLWLCQWTIVLACIASAVNSFIHMELLGLIAYALFFAIVPATYLSFDYLRQIAGKFHLTTLKGRIALLQWGMPLALGALLAIGRFMAGRRTVIAAIAIFVIAFAMQIYSNVLAKRFRSALKAMPQTQAANLLEGQG